jgi:hypothetical protein
MTGNDSVACASERANDAEGCARPGISYKNT